MIEEPERWKFRNRLEFEQAIRRVVNRDDWIIDDEFIFVINDEVGSNYRDLVLARRASIVDGSWGGILNSEFNIWVHDGGGPNDRYYHIGIKKDGITKARFVDWVMENQPDYAEWLLFHPEWL